MQDRPPPAFQEYAAAMLARVEFRMMSLSEKGLLYLMRLECWVNHGLPENPATLAKILGLDPAEVKAALPAVMPFFAIENALIICPELDAYRAHLDEARKRMIEGGKRGADKTNDKRKRKKQQGVTATPSATPSGTPPGSGRGLSTVQTNPNQSKALSLGRGINPIDDSFVESMGQGPFSPVPKKKGSPVH
jgi:uncharacterized protein YdaU (DUF1376 family)